MLRCRRFSGLSTRPELALKHSYATGPATKSFGGPNPGGSKYPIFEISGNGRVFQLETSSIGYLDLLGTGGPPLATAKTQIVQIPSIQELGPHSHSRYGL